MPAVELVKKSPPYLYDEQFKLIMGDEFCFRSDCEGCSLESECKSEPIEVDVSQEPNVRKAFVARSGYKLVAVDYSGIELRIAANFSKEPVWVNAFLAGLDLHDETAKVIFGPNFTKAERQMAKCVRRGTDIKFRLLLAARSSPVQSEVQAEVVELETLEGVAVYLEDTGVHVLNQRGEKLQKLMKEVVAGEYLLEPPQVGKRRGFKRPIFDHHFGKKVGYLQEGMSLAQVKKSKAFNLDGMIVKGVTLTTMTMYASDFDEEIDFAHIDEHRSGEFMPLMNTQVQTALGWKTVAFLYFDGVRDFWSLRVGTHKVDATEAHRFYARRDGEEEWIKISELDSETDMVQVLENGNLVWKQFTTREPEALDYKRIREKENQEQKFFSRDLMFDLVVPDGHEYIVDNYFRTHNTCNFSNLYGGSPYSLAAAANIPRERAGDIWDRWWKALPKLKEWVEGVHGGARVVGHVKTACGRIRSLLQWYITGDRKDRGFADRSSVSTLIQGTAADLMKIALAACTKYIEQYGLEDEVKLLLAVHDEIVFEIKEDKLENHLNWIAPVMARTPKGWIVPLKVDVEVGDNWGEVKELKGWECPDEPVFPNENPKPNLPEIVEMKTTKEPAQDDLKPESLVVVLEKAFWSRKIITRVLKAWKKHPGSMPVLLKVGGQEFSGNGFPPVDPEAFCKALDEIRLTI